MAKGWSFSPLQCCIVLAICDRALPDLQLVCRVLEVASYVDSKLEAEKEPGCSACASNRRMLEKAWQTIANEYYDPTGNFSQAKWAKELLIALQVRPQTLPC